MSEKDVLRLDRPIPPPLPPRAPSRQPPPPVSAPFSPTTSHQLPEPFQSPPAGPPPPYEPEVSYESEIPYESKSPYDSKSPYSAADGLPSLATNDPRSSSTQSLVPTRSNEGTDRRRLLLIFIHGFMGNETSFQSFPAHVHNLVATLVADTHVVHTKIYPRYRSKKNITFARDDFGRWLEPHEGHSTDVVLLGHSMGGLVSAEVALSQLSSDPHSRMRHRIVGTVNFDVPFLGMHPSVIKSGLASIFSPGPESPKPQAEAGSMTSLNSGTMSPGSGNASTAGRASGPPALPPRRSDTLFSPEQPDPNYNPSFENDVILPMRKGWLNAWHFVSKHNDNLVAATKQLVKSHMEFGGAMADYSGLKNRYCRIRALEEANAEVRTSIMGGSISPPRVRFVNYYTSSTGRPKKAKSPVVSPLDPSDGTAAASMTSLVASVEQPSSEQAVPVIAEPAQVGAEVSPPATEDQTKGGEEEDEESVYDLEESNNALRQMDNLEPLPMSDYGGESSDAESWTDAMEDLGVSDAPPAATAESALKNSAISKQSSALVDAPSLPDATPIIPSAAGSSSTLEPYPSTGHPSTNDSSISLATTSSLPPIPEAPPKPTEPDFSVYTDKETRKIAEKDYSRVMKTYERAIRDRERTIRDREKLEEKRKRAAIKEGKRVEQAEEKESKRKEKEREKEAKQKQKVQGDAQEKKFELQRRETEQEWKETLDMKWNAEDGTVVPMPTSSTGRHGQATRSSSLAPSTSLTTGTSLYSVQTGAGEDSRPRKERTFCTLPPKDASGNRDPVWVKVFMPDVDEVGAHCGLFFETSPAYEQLVGDVGEKVTEWVAEAESERVALELSQE